MLPKDFPLWPTIYWWFRTLRAPALVPHDQRRGADAGPGEVWTRSQPIRRHLRRPVGGRRTETTRGYDAGKKILGRKRPIAVDPDIRLLMINLISADVSDSTGVQAIIIAIRKRRSLQDRLGGPDFDGTGSMTLPPMAQAPVRR